ncbi:triacylglycerol lipase [Desertifilum sp. FACHB-1129]|uniref:Lipase n=2 Tax=Desertifilum tharense IPPAS B-1220 TaxID=1781255 RepID=A0A1E5QNM1_9CYAN|nr:MULTISPECIES: triacylglycerol lipase [Desertifilum]MDA0212228.1 triacylglycerol lipase [Cyanobacteria bacterium FC1]MBD2312807.1 triacylglycerol lipase [Desertifilum sp. FACHB-1129]MBD2324171.1 triacylglycerol lipase [Desertifilum sp. FACHB-866]MBD2334185.1 triacylglycerol lipase [Desertifilum sp. FACHB-868]OEJ76250.1 lipase [Desertifilum tharense IPPAS B-1220]
MKSIQPNPVILIHGIDDTALVFQTMSQQLSRRGWDVHSLSLTPSNGEIGLDRLAQQIADYVSLTFKENQPFDLVGFSMGGIISRYYVQRLGGIQRVQRFVTISSPHCGSWVGYARHNIGCQQMRPNSRFLNDLKRDIHILDKIDFTSIWTPYDLMIVPAHSSCISVGREIILPILLHSWMLTDPRCIAQVAQVLAEPLRQNHAKTPQPRPVSPRYLYQEQGI